MEHTRRTVVRAGAWTVPVIATAAVLPSASASSTDRPAQLLITGLNMNGVSTAGKTIGLRTQFSVQNQYYAPYPAVSATLTSVIATAAFSANQVTAVAATSVTGSGWTASAPVSAGGLLTYTFTWTGTAAPGGTTSTLDFQVALTDSSPGVRSLTVKATGSNATSDTKVATYTVPG
ncbi:hypothetical protein V3G39_11665 [Dermatophilaceae bacterium Sec6.4]